MRGNDALRNPVSSYGDALSWLFTHSQVEEWAFAREPELPNEARLVCDMFWINSDKLLRDLRKLWNDTLNPAPTHAPYRHVRYAGWR